jgi:hypothetical protein
LDKIATGNLRGVLSPMFAEGENKKAKRSSCVWLFYYLKELLADCFIGADVSTNSATGTIGGITGCL